MHFKKIKPYFLSGPITMVLFSSVKNLGLRRIHEFHNRIVSLFYNLLGIIDISVILHLTNSCQTCVILPRKIKIQVMCKSKWHYQSSLEDIIKYSRCPSYFMVWYGMVHWETSQTGLSVGSLWMVRRYHVLICHLLSFLSSTHTEIPLYFLIIDPIITNYYYGVIDFDR